MDETPKTPVEIVVCDKHGLRYNALTDTGCARCKREAVGSERAKPPSSEATMKNQAAIAAGLVLVTGLGLYGGRQGVVASLGTAVATGGPAYAEAPGMVTDNDVLMVVLTDPELQAAIEEDRELRNAFDSGDMDTIREFIIEYYGDDPLAVGYPDEAVGPGDGAYDEYDEYDDGSYYDEYDD